MILPRLIICSDPSTAQDMMSPKAGHSNSVQCLRRVAKQRARNFPVKHFPTGKLQEWRMRRIRKWVADRMPTHVMATHQQSNTKWLVQSSGVCSSRWKGNPHLSCPSTPHLCEVLKLKGANHVSEKNQRWHLLHITSRIRFVSKLARSPCAESVTERTGN